ncbi:hypothetical protein FRC09_005080, partial [Ceratobasidium sp. 395]
MDLVAATLVVAALTVDFIVFLRFVAAVLFYGSAAICFKLQATPVNTILGQFATLEEQEDLILIAW